MNPDRLLLRDRIYPHPTCAYLSEQVNARTHLRYSSNSDRPTPARFASCIADSIYYIDTMAIVAGLKIQANVEAVVEIDVNVEM